MANFESLDKREDTQTRFSSLGLGEPVRQRLAELSGAAPEVCWLPSDRKESWRSATDLETLKGGRRRPMFITTTWHAPDPDNTDAMLHLADGVWVDIDIKDKVHEGIEDAVQALGETVVKLQTLGIRIECCSLFASGGKGFHIHIPLALMASIECCDLSIARAWPRLCREFVDCSLLTNLTDRGIYSGRQGRLFRQANVQRDNGLYKVPLAWDAWQGLTADSYRDACSAPRDAIKAQPVEGIAVNAAAAWSKAIKVVTQFRSKPTRPIKGITLGSGGRFLTTDRMRIETALKASCGPLDYLDWIRIGMALKSTGASDAIELWIKYSRLHPKYKPGECESKWDGFDSNRVGLGTLFKIAKNGGRK